MFCRFCGARILPDSRFCSSCGQRLTPPVPGKAAARPLYRNTPYPYALVLFLVFVAWTMRPEGPPFDYSNVRMELELLGRSDLVESTLYRHHFSLIVENVGSEPIPAVRVVLRARVDSNGPARVESDFLGRRLVLIENAEVHPLVVSLDDDLAVGEKRRYSVDGIVTAEPPFTVTYEILEEDSDEVLVVFTDSVGDSDEGPGSTPAEVLVRDRFARSREPAIVRSGFRAGRPFRGPHRS